MLHATPLFARVAFLGVVATAVAIDLVSVILRSPWVLPLGSLLGALLTITVLLWGPWETSLHEITHGVGQQVSRGEAAFSFVAGGILVAVFDFLLGTREITGICARQASCSPKDWFNLTILGLFFSVLTLCLLFVAFIVLGQLRRPQKPPETE